MNSFYIELTTGREMTIDGITLLDAFVKAGFLIEETKIIKNWEIIPQTTN